MKIHRPGPLVLYMLHFSKPVGKAQHYVGSTFERRLTRRLQTHARGAGSSLTRAAVAAGSRLALVYVQPILTRADEYAFKARGHFRDRCPICNGTRNINQTDFIWFEGLSAEEWEGLHWASSQPPPVPSHDATRPDATVKGSALPPAPPGDRRSSG